MTTKRLKRYHRSVYFPEWSDEALQNFIKEVANNSPLKFSLHSVEKLSDCISEYGRKMLRFFLKIVKRNSLTIDTVFEFYSVDQRVKKACFRYTFPNYPVDLVIVLSADGVVITIFVVNKWDDHATLDEKLYERSS